MEALAIDAAPDEPDTTGLQLRTLLNIPSRYELDGFLKHHNVPLRIHHHDFDREAETSARLQRKRQGENETSPRF